MADLFLAADPIIAAIEKPYSNDPTDPGGETKWGIARNRHPEISPDAWANFTAADAQKMRRQFYWEKYRCGEMPWQFALGLYDGVINQGGAVVRMLQGAIGVPQDGIIGDRTVATAHSSTAELFWMFMAYRARSYVEDKTYDRDGLGWFKRLFQIAQCAVIIPVGSISSEGPS